MKAEIAKVVAMIGLASISTFALADHIYGNLSIVDIHLQGQATPQAFVFVDPIPSPEPGCYFITPYFPDLTVPGQKAMYEVIKELRAANKPISSLAINSSCQITAINF